MNKKQMAIGKGYEGRFLSEDEVGELVSEALSGAEVSDKRVLVLIPDHTRTAPIPLMFRLICDALGEQVKSLDFMVALGTHPPLPEEMIHKLVGITEEDHQTRYRKIRFFNHLWQDPGALTQVGKFSESEIDEISDGLFKMEVPVVVNKLVLDYDLLLIVGPVFPHEVVGFSGGNKYLFPGVAGERILNFFHWLGAVITNPVINGNKWTPVRKVVDRAAGMVSTPKMAFCLVVHQEKLAGLYFGTPKEAWSEAADLSDKLHIIYKDRPYHTVLSQAPEMYDDIWLAGKCMYKLEPVVADGGTLIIYAPHITEVSVTHGQVLDEIGYHTRDYFLKQWDKFKHHPWGVIAHSTHVKGIGSYEEGIEKPRVNVILATGIPEERCQRINLGYLDPASINPADYANREDEGILYVPKAGEILYRLKDALPHLGGKK